MSVYAKGMSEVTKMIERHKRNPKKQVDIKWNSSATMDDYAWESIKGTKIGKGSFATVYLGVDNMVYMEIEDGTDPTKELLSMINIYEGPQPHIPIVKRMGWNTKKGKDYTIFQSPLYRVPLRKKDFPKEYAIMKQLQKMLEYSYNRLSFSQMGSCYAGHELRNVFLSAIQDIGAPKGVTNSEWQSVVTALELMLRYAEDFGDTIYMEFPARNLGTDANGQLILLDILFDKKELLKQRGVRC